MKTKINNSIDLKNAIQLLEFEHDNEWILLKHSAKQTYEQMNPLRILKDSVKELALMPDLKDKLIASVVGMAAGYLSKKLVSDEDDGVVKKFLGSILQMGVSTEISQKPEYIKMLISLVTNSLKSKNKPI